MLSLRIYTDPACLDHEWLLRTLGASYWGGSYTRVQILRALDHSLCFGAYLGDPSTQIGFVRVVTDHAIFSSITDVIVDPQWRGQGVGTKLLEAVVAHPAVATTICVLETRHARGLYKKFGFSEGGDVLKRNPTI